MRLTVAFSLALTFLFGGHLGAQISSDPVFQRFTIGDRVRVVASEVESRRFTGTLSSIDPDTLVVRRSLELVRLPLGSIDRLEVSLGKDRRRAARNGAITGAIVLFALVYASEPGYARDGIPVWIILGGAPGGLIGALLARERWLSWPLPLE